MWNSGKLHPVFFACMFVFCACDPEVNAILPDALQSAAPTPTPLAPVFVTPSATPLPKPIFSQTPDYFKNIKGWQGSFKVGFSHEHQADKYRLTEQYQFVGDVKMLDQSTNGSFFSWPLPTNVQTLSGQMQVQNHLVDQQRPDFSIERSCRFTGNQDLDLGLVIRNGTYRLNGRLMSAEASCTQIGKDNPPGEVLPTLAFVEKMRYWEFTEPLPAKGSILSGSRTINLDEKNLVFIWELKPIK